MIAYVDSSVLLRIVLQQPGAARELLGFDDRVTSMIADVECLCAMDAALARGDLDEAQWADRRTEVYAQLSRMQRVLPTASVLRRAGMPLPVPLRALDAIHLATALIWRVRRAPELVFATHDRHQARAALALGFEVLGI